MILIADAGGTKTDWRLVNGDQVRQFDSEGFNFKTHPLEPFLANLPEDLLALEKVQKVQFYAAGIATPHDAAIVSKRFSSLFPGAEVESYSDTLGAGRSLFGTDKGYACLLGTGSGAAYYNGRDITSRIPSLGYVLGDEGSGADLGRLLLNAVLRERLPSGMHERFAALFPDIIESTVLEAVYRQPKTNLFLAGFTRFLIDHQQDPFIHDLIAKSFHRYFEAYFPDKEANAQHAFRFAGSVAHWLSNILRRVAAGHGITIERIAQSPIAGLTLYHQQYG